MKLWHVVALVAGIGGGYYFWSRGGSAKKKVTRSATPGAGAGPLDSLPFGLGGYARRFTRTGNAQEDAAITGAAAGAVAGLPNAASKVASLFGGSGHDLAPNHADASTETPQYQDGPVADDATEDGYADASEMPIDEAVGVDAATNNVPDAGDYGDYSADDGESIDV